MPPAQPTPTPSPAAPATPQTLVSANVEDSKSEATPMAGRIRRGTDIGLSGILDDVSSTAAIRNVATEPVWLTADVLERQWKRMVEEAKDDVVLVQLLSRVRRVFVDESHFHVVTTDPEVQTSFLSKKEKVLTMLQKLTNNPAIDFDILFEEVKKNTDYDPEEKYRNMLEKNPAMRGLRELFTEVEIG